MQGVGHAVLCLSCCAVALVPMEASQQLSRQPAPVQLTHSPPLQPTGTMIQAYSSFALDTEKLSSQTKGKQESLPPQGQLSKVMVSPFGKAQCPLCSLGMWERVSLKTFLGERFRVASCSPAILLTEGGFE